MALTPDYPAWFAQVESDDHEDIYALYKAVEHAIDTGYYRCAENDDGSWTVSTAAVEDHLLLASQEARQALLTLIEARYFAGMDSENWIEMMRALTGEGGC